MHQIKLYPLDDLYNYRIENSLYIHMYIHTLIICLTGILYYIVLQLEVKYYSFQNLIQNS